MRVTVMSATKKQWLHNYRSLQTPTVHPWVQKRQTTTSILTVWPCKVKKKKKMERFNKFYVHANFPFSF